MLCLSLWLTGLIWFIGQIPTQLSVDFTKTDAIVVLTGGKNRLEYGLELLSEDMGKKLFVTGVHENITVENLLLRSSSTEAHDKLLPIAKTAIILGHEAENTIGNAEETRRWLKAEHYTSIHLVTSNYHMPRSLEEFQKTIPGITIIPTPVIPEDFSLNDWWDSPENRNLLLSEYHKYLASIARHYFLSLLHRP